MLHAVILAAALTASDKPSHRPPKTAVQRCLSAMDGAVYDGDPSDRRLMQANVSACEIGYTQIARIRPPAALGPEKLFLSARILDRAATLSYMGLNDARTALREVATANLYFRVAAGLAGQSMSYHEAAVANVTLTAIQMRTLHSDLAEAVQRTPTPPAYAYHKL